MEIIKKIREFFNAKPVGAPVDFSHLSKQKKVEMLEREADVFVKKYGQVIKKLWSPSPAANALAVGDGRIAVVSDPRVLDLYGLPGS